MPDRLVSFDDERLIVVDTDDGVIGYETKRHVHRGSGLLHRAFSIFLISPTHGVLMQRRSVDKPLWPLFWSTSCCSHPRKDESYLDAAQRRLDEELGLVLELRVLFQLRYWAGFEDLGAEREHCRVLIGQVADASSVRANASEIADWIWIEPRSLDQWVSRHPKEFTPWFRLQWQRLRSSDVPELRPLRSGRALSARHYPGRRRPVGLNAGGV
jgi:isopentenyl-diphosphate delta-isomerase